MKKIYFLLFVALVSLAGCSQYKEVDINSVKIDKINLVSAKEIDLQLKASVENPTKTPFELKSINGKMYRNGAEFANLVLLEESLVPSKHNGDVPLKCRLTLTDPLAALALGLNIASLNSDDFTIDFVATVQGGVLKKSFKYKDVPMSQIMKMFDIKL